MTTERDQEARMRGKLARERGALRLAPTIEARRRPSIPRQWPGPIADRQVRAAPARTLRAIVRLGRTLPLQHVNERSSQDAQS
jgi:hypothetical protein